MPSYITMTYKNLSNLRHAASDLNVAEFSLDSQAIIKFSLLVG